MVKITCANQNCSKEFEFDPATTRKSETRMLGGSPKKVVEYYPVCPHCGTTLVIPRTTQ